MMITSEDVIKELNKLKIKEHFDNKNKKTVKYIVTKEKVDTYGI